MYFLIVFLLIWTLSPGPITVLILKHTKQHGQSAGVSVAAGTAFSALLILSLFLMAQQLGLDILLAAGESTMLERLGASVIMGMGLVGCFKVFLDSSDNKESDATTAQKPRSFLHGMLIFIAYIPQSIIFFAVLIPQNFSPETVHSAIVGFGIGMVALKFFWYAGVAVVAQRLQSQVQRPRLSKSLDFATAGLLIAFGLNILV